MAILWTFRCYCLPDGTDEIRSWYDAQGKKVQATFLSRLRMLAQLPQEEWNTNFYKNLRGNCAGLGEIRFFSDNVQQRPLGYRSGNNEFTILFCATEKGGKFVPLSACEQAFARKSELQKKKGKTSALWLALE